MANQEQVDILKQGVDIWNDWRREHPKIEPDLTDADLSGADLSRAYLWRADLQHANLSGADLRQAYLEGVFLMGAKLIGANLCQARLSRAELLGANLNEAILARADLRKADLDQAHLNEAQLFGADLKDANLRDADLIKADLEQAHFYRANLYRADLSGAFLSGTCFIDADLRGADLSGAFLYRANLSGAILVGTNLTNTKLIDCTIYGISAWDVQLHGAEQLNLTITSDLQPTITVDNLKIAQFIYLLLNNAEIRDVIDSITSKVVLILGRFTPERKAVLDVIRKELRKRNYSPVLFDFDKPASRDITETISTLAHLARFIIADLTDPSSIPQELQAIVPTLAVPVQPVLLEGKTEYSMFSDFLKTYHWVLPIYRYADLQSLITTLNEKVLAPAEQKAKELGKR